MNRNNKKNAFAFFFRKYPKDTITVVLLLFFAGVAEALGVAAFLPFIQIFIEGQKEITTLPFEWGNHFIQKHSISLNFKTVGSFIITAIALKAFILWIAIRKVSQIVSTMTEDFRNTYLQSILHSKWSFLVSHPLGESLNAVSHETFRAAQTFLSTTKFISAFIQVTLYTISAFLLSWKACIAILLTGAIVALTLWGFVRTSRQAGRAQTDSSKSMMRHISDTIQAIKPLRAMASENHYIDRLNTYSKDLKNAHFKQMISGQSLRIFHEPLMVVAAIIGIYLATNIGGIEGSALIVIMVFFMRIMTGLNAAQSEYQRLVKEESALWSITKVIKDTQEQAENTGGTDDPPHPIQFITFDGVSFHHGENPILQNIDSVFKKATFILLMGHSGSGKTTILDLLSGFVSPSSGQILINETPFNDIKKVAWRKKIGFLPQEVFLFNESVKDNILMGRHDISDKDIWAALKESGAEDFVISLDNGLNTLVGENGRRLSGGQKQRIAIARAIVHKPEILILDEATSALDKETESALLDTFKTLSTKMMVIMASHSQAATAYADIVITLDTTDNEENDE